VIRFKTRGRAKLEDGQPGFGGGLVTSPTDRPADLRALPLNSLTAAIFCRLTPEGALQKLGGSIRLHASALAGGAINGGFAWRKGDGTIQQLVTTSQLHTGDYSSVPMTWTAQAGGLDAATRHSFAAFRDGSGECVYIADGGALNKWTGAAVTTNIAGTPNVTQLCVYNQRLYAISGTDQTLYWSGLNDGDSLGNAAAGGGQAVVRTFGGQRLTALAVVGGSLLLFHDTAISRFTGYAQDDIDIDAGVIGHASVVGTAAPRSVAVIDHEGRDVALFVSAAGLYQATEGGIAAVPTPFADPANVWYTTGLHAVHNPRRAEVWFLVPNRGMYIYHYRLNAWTGPHGESFTDASTGPRVMWGTAGVLKDEQILSGAADGFVRQYDRPYSAVQDMRSDGTGGTAPSMFAKTRPWFFKDESLTKSFRHLYVTARALLAPTSATVQWYVNGGAVAGSGTITPTTTYATHALPWWGTGEFVEIEIRDDGADPTLYSGLRGEALALGRRR
jgi:hypothetical protein